MEKPYVTRGGPVGGIWGPLSQAREDIARLMREECAGLSLHDIPRPLF